MCDQPSQCIGTRPNHVPYLKPYNRFLALQPCLALLVLQWVECNCFIFVQATFLIECTSLGGSRLGPRIQAFLSHIRIKLIYTELAKLQHCTFRAIECQMICILPKLNSLLQIFFFARIQRLRQNFVLSLTDDSLPNNSIWKSVSKKFSGDKNCFKNLRL